MRGISLVNHVQDLHNILSILGVAQGSLWCSGTYATEIRELIGDTGILRKHAT